MYATDEEPVLVLFQLWLEKYKRVNGLTFGSVLVNTASGDGSAAECRSYFTAGPKTKGLAGGSLGFMFRPSITPTVVVLLSVFAGGVAHASGPFDFSATLRVDLHHVGDASKEVFMLD